MRMMTDGGTQNGFHIIFYLQLSTENRGDSPFDRMGTGGSFVPKAIETNDSSDSRPINGELGCGLLDNSLPFSHI